ncbi:OLC1v1013361C1 [Oldenlandia corymbosa var. corymbosa]|uniref:OLC1v1013361C1 n=1 Tax=Oldenlandia corymbosa var. corymbosa TaxID=529605 RepID=A0AAV1E056_OLDCO|nr:OLC1v1013361C1 [Oldenlandia corymbosa var. corymbosa]
MTGLRVAVEESMREMELLINVDNVQLEALDRLDDRRCSYLDSKLDKLIHKQDLQFEELIKKLGRSEDQDSMSQKQLEKWDSKLNRPESARVTMVTIPACQQGNFPSPVVNLVEIVASEVVPSKLDGYSLLLDDNIIGPDDVMSLIEAISNNENTVKLNTMNEVLFSHDDEIAESVVCVQSNMDSMSRDEGHDYMPFGFMNVDRNSIEDDTRSKHLKCETLVVEFDCGNGMDYFKDKVDKSWFKIVTECKDVTRVDIGTHGITNYKVINPSPTVVEDQAKLAGNVELIWFIVVGLLEVDCGVFFDKVKLVTIVKDVLEYKQDTKVLAFGYHLS